MHSFQIWLDAYYPNIHSSKYVFVVYSLGCVGEPHDDLQHIHGTARRSAVVAVDIVLLPPYSLLYKPFARTYPSTSSHLRPVPALVLSEADTLVPLFRVCSPVIMSKRRNVKGKGHTRYII